MDKYTKLLFFCIGLLVVSIIIFVSIVVSAQGQVTEVKDEPKQEIKEKELSPEEQKSIQQQTTQKQEVQVPVVDIKEQKWKEAQLRVPPLSADSGVGYSNGWKLTYYPSRAAYHYLTPTWSLTPVHKGLSYYMEWVDSVQDWCFVISVAKSYGYMNTVINFDFGPCIVRDCGCAEGTVDMYVY